MADPFPGGLQSPQDFLNGILPRAPNVAIDFVKQMLLTVARDFFQFSGAWRDWTAPFILTPMVDRYSVELTDFKAELVSVLNGYVLENGFEIFPAYPYERYIDQMRTQNDQPRFFNQDPEGLVHIFPILPINSPVTTCKLFVTMKPTDLCWPSWVSSKHYDAICDGVLGKLYLSPGPNYHADLGARMEKRYVNARAKAGTLALTGGVNIHEQVMPPLFAQGTGLRRRSSYSYASDGRWWGR